jgi:hypothetical protein
MVLIGPSLFAATAHGAGGPRPPGCETDLCIYTYTIIRIRHYMYWGARGRPGGSGGAGRAGPRGRAAGAEVGTDGEEEEEGPVLGESVEEERVLACDCNIFVYGCTM